MDAPPDEITRLLHRLSGGDQEAASDLISIVYDELRRLAAHYMGRERPDHTLQATALVHEAYLRLTKQRGLDWQSREHFFGVAAQLMRRILVDHARTRLSGKRGGGRLRVPLEETVISFSDEQSEEVLALDAALTRLAEMDPRQARVVELRFFAGLTVEETARVLGISPKSVKRDWEVARAWLHREIA